MGVVFWLKCLMINLSPHLVGKLSGGNFEDWCNGSTEDFGSSSRSSSLLSLTKYSGVMQW